VIEAQDSRLVAIVSSNDIDAAEAWWNRLGFRRPPDQDWGDYRILTDGFGAEIHLTAAVEGWLIAGHNPFGVYLYTPRVDELAAIAREAILGTGDQPEHKPWGMYEFALNGPDDLLVRIGWPAPTPPRPGSPGA
jgi:hypothetical protein